jgi:hypothetical protein
LLIRCKAFRQMLSDASFTCRRRILCAGAAGTFVLGYVILLYWFGSRKFYHLHFFDRGLPVRHYDCARLIFIFYFAWLVYAAGAVTMQIVAGADSFTKIPARERFPLGFLVGVAVWSILLFPFGLVGLYETPLAFAITIAAILVSIPHLIVCTEAGASALARAWMSSAIFVGSIRQNATFGFCRAAKFLVQWLVWIAVALAVTTFLLVKGLYPGGGHDYYNHYFPYYLRVIQTGSILPNDVWYHFYLSKGDGLYFLAMLLTDPLAPQLVTAGFILCASSIVFALLRGSSPTGLLPWVGALLYFAFFTYTPGPHEFMVAGGWGDLEKEHELTAVLLLGVIWCVVRLCGSSGENNRLWIIGLHASIVSTIFITPQLGFLIGLYLAGFVLWFALKRQWRLAFIPFFGCVTAAITMAAIFLINYDLTGLPLDQSILFTWPVVNLAKVAQWGATFEMIDLDKRMLELSASAASWSRTIFWLVPCYLRLELWWPLIGIASVFGVHRIVSSKNMKNATPTPITPLIWALFWFCGTVVIAAIVGGGRSQAVTFYRLSSFSYAPTLCMGLAIWQFGLGDASWTRLDPIKTILAGSLSAVLLIGIAIEGKRTGELDRIEGAVNSIIDNAAAFWSGRYSVADAYQNQQGWPGRMPWGGIYPGLTPVWRLLPPFTRVWSFHVWTYCMLPDCNFQGYFSFIFSPRWRTVYFGTPEASRAALQAENLNYFFFSNKMEISDSIGHAPLFSPDNIAKYLAIRWTDGTNYLLTWPGSDTRPLDDDFISAYRNLTVKSDTYLRFDVKQWEAIANQIGEEKSAGRGLHPFVLPWCSSLTWCHGGP